MGAVRFHLCGRLLSLSTSILQRRAFTSAGKRCAETQDTEEYVHTNTGPLMPLDNRKAFKGVRQPVADAHRASEYQTRASKHKRFAYGESRLMPRTVLGQFRPVEPVQPTQTWELNATASSKVYNPAKYNPSKEDFLEVTPNQSIKERTITIPRDWLRDHCQCSECVHPVTKQRIFDTFSFQSAPSIADCSVEGSSVNITWNGGHKSNYSTDWLARAFDVAKTLADRQGVTRPTWWHQASVRESPPEMKYEDVMNSTSGVAEWTRKIREVGFCFVDGCPPTPEGTQALLERIGPVRNTHYGSFWDFTSNMASKDTAYTDLALDVHTDTNYFTDSAGLQMFHLLEHDGEGGESQLVDGFRAALLLKLHRPSAYLSLSLTKMFFHASGNEGLSIQPQTAFPTLVHDPTTETLVQVRWNNADRGAVLSNPFFLPKKTRDWYAYMKKFDKILKDDKPDLRYEFQLRPGRPLIFDNWRVLHGRSAFTGRRRMCGGYINRDDFISRYRTSNFGYKKVLETGIY